MDAVDNTERIENEYFKKQDGSQQPASQVEISNKNTVHLFLSYSSPGELYTNERSNEIENYLFS